MSSSALIRLLKATSVSVIIYMLGGCKPAPQPNDLQNMTAPTPAVDTPYAIWVTDAYISGNQLSEKLSQNPSYGDSFCQADSAKPAGYSTTFALISTHQYDRLDLIERYQINADKAATWGGTGVLLTKKVGNFVAQNDKVNIADPTIRKAALKTIKITLSKQGKFSGYCNETKGYFYSIHSHPETGQMGIFSVRCNNPETTVACMSIR
ncbi:MAG: hypothetical protein HWE26_16005 [Alteromonadaceae bacterium]|nr:hypothetical protein [Alteromonadaceae bacterium]